MRSGGPRLWIVLAALTLDALGLGLAIPIVPQLVRVLSHQTASGAAEWVGALVSAYALATFICSPVLGGLSDRFGRRPVILLSLCGSAANYVLLSVAPDLGWLFVGRLIAGATAANVSAVNAYIADITPVAQRGQRFGLVGAVFGGGFVLGPAMGGLLGAIGLRLPFMVAAGLAAANVVASLIFLPESLPPDRRRPFDWRRANPVGSLRVLLAVPTTARLAGAWCCLWTAFGAIQACFVLYTEYRFGWGPGWNGAALAAMGLSLALVQGLLVRHAVLRLGERRSGVVGMIVTAAGYLLLGLTPWGWGIFLGIVVQALGGVATPSIRALISATAPPERQGEVLGGMASVEGLTAIVAPTLASLVFSLTTRHGNGWSLPGAPFVIGAAACLGAAMLVARTGPAGG